MRKLEAKKDKGRYKSTSHWLDAVYRNNKEFIDNKLKNVKSLNKKRTFKNLVLEMTGFKFRGNLTIKELNFELNKSKKPTKALKKLYRSDVFSSYKERECNGGKVPCPYDRNGFVSRHFFYDISSFNSRHWRKDTDE